MSFLTQLDLARQSKILSGETASFDGSIEIKENFTNRGLTFVVSTGDTNNFVLTKSGNTIVFSPVSGGSGSNITGTTQGSILNYNTATTQYQENVAVRFISSSLLITDSAGNPTTLPGGEGAGSRLLWHQEKLAFRAGSVIGTEWDDVNIGTRSFAFGLRVLVASTDCFAVGRENSISGTGTQSVVLGGTRNIITGTNNSRNGIIAGSDNSILGNNSSNNLIGGNQNAISSSSFNFVFGSGNISNNNSFSVLLGQRLTSSTINHNRIGQFGNIITGQSSSSFLRPDELFTIDNGTSDTNTNTAFRIFKSGSIFLNNVLTGTSNTTTASTPTATGNFRFERIGNNIFWNGNQISTGGSGSTSLSGLTDVLITSPLSGQTIQYDGIRWVNVFGTGSGSTNAITLSGQTADYFLNRANHTNTQLSSTISDFNTSVSGIVDTYIAQTTGTSTSLTMSQNAITQAINSSAVNWNVQQGNGTENSVLSFNTINLSSTTLQVTNIPSVSPLASDLMLKNTGIGGEISANFGNSFSIGYSSLPINFIRSTSGLEILSDGSMDIRSQFFLDIDAPNEAVRIQTSGGLFSIFNASAVGQQAIPTSIDDGFTKLQSYGFFSSGTINLIAQVTGTSTSLTMSQNAIRNAITASTLTQEQVQDFVGSMFTGGTEVSLTYNDAGNGISGALVNNSVALARLVNNSGLTIIGKSTAGAGANTTIALNPSLIFTANTLSVNLSQTTGTSTSATISQSGITTLFQDRIRVVNLSVPNTTFNIQLSAGTRFLCFLSGGTGTFTFDYSGGTQGEDYQFFFIQPTGTTRQITFQPNKFSAFNGVAPTLTTITGRTDIISGMFVNNTMFINPSQNMRVI